MTPKTLLVETFLFMGRMTPFLNPFSFIDPKYPSVARFLRMPNISHNSFDQKGSMPTIIYLAKF